MTERCPWCGTDPLYMRYHDEEWGVPEYNPRALWEKLVLDGFQAGLSWITILRKRPAFQEQFKGFDPEVIAGWGQADIDNAMQNPRIIRHRGKIESSVRGARLFLEIESSTGFAPFLWDFVGGQVVQNQFERADQVPTQSPASVAMAKALKQKGFGFCGPVICYAFMEAVGMVNDHLTTCHRHAQIRALSPE